MDENWRRELWRDWDTNPSNFSGPRRAERVFRLKINLTDRSVSELSEFAFPLRAISDSMNPDLPALWPAGPRQASGQVAYRVLKLPRGNV
jgi:hypothetical protein